MKYVHTNIVAQNWRKLADFYINVFRCEIKPPQRNQSGDWLEKGTGLSNASLEGVHLSLPGYGPNGPTLEIYQYGHVEFNPPSHPNTRGYGHIAFEVEDIEEIASLILEHGGSLQGEITEKLIEGVGTITFMYVRDPEGNLIEIQKWH